MKIRLRWVQTLEYEPCPECYPEDKRTPEAMLEVDLAAVTEDPNILFDSENPFSEITGEILP